MPFIVSAVPHPGSRFSVPSRKEVSLLCAFLDVIAKISYLFEMLNIQLDSEAVRTKTIETRWNECEIIYIASTFLCRYPHCLTIRLNLNISKKAYYYYSSPPLEFQAQIPSLVMLEKT